MSKIEQQVMANVTLIYAARIATSATALKLYTLALSVLGLAALVSISNIAANFVNVLTQGGVGGVLGFVISALLGTTIVVQLTLAVAAASAALLVAPVLRPSGRALA